MTDAELRSLVRTAVARHLGVAAPPVVLRPAEVVVLQPAESARPLHLHSSHSLYAGLVNVTSECLIEPAVACDHCGYCKSHGH